MNVRVILSPEAEEVYNELSFRAATSKIERSILKSIDQKKGLIKNNFQYGEPIAKKLIPREYVIKYGVNNLFWVKDHGLKPVGLPSALQARRRQAFFAGALLRRLKPPAPAHPWSLSGIGKPLENALYSSQ